jgi:hypothetical protein
VRGVPGDVDFGRRGACPDLEVFETAATLLSLAWPIVLSLPLSPFYSLRISKWNARNISTKHATWTAPARPRKPVA